MPEIIPPEDTNPEIKTYSTEEGKLIVERTHGKPVVHTDSYLIKDAEVEIAKINSVIALWENKKQPYQDIVNKYDEIKPQPKG